MSKKMKAQIGREDLNFVEHLFDDEKVTGAQIGEAAGAHPLKDFIVLQQLPSYEIETLRPTELADLKKSLRFFVIKSDVTFQFLIDGLSMAWPLEKVTGHTLLFLAGKEDGFEILLEREDQPDKIVGMSDEVRISKSGTEEFTTRAKHGPVTIIVEGTPHEWDQNKISYDEVVTLEVPDYAQHPEITYSIKYKNGPGNKPEGILVKGASVKVKNGMIFSVSETGQS